VCFVDPRPSRVHKTHCFPEVSVNKCFIIYQYFIILSDLECEIKQYKTKDIILIVWKIIGTLGIYLQNGMVFMNDFLLISTVWVYCMWKRRRNKFRNIPLYKPWKNWLNEIIAHVVVVLLNWHIVARTLEWQLLLVLKH
jgi:hypothetical protein